MNRRLVVERDLGRPQHLVVLAGGVADDGFASVLVDQAVTEELPGAIDDAFLERRCTPCHEPGGKMYDRLPYDKAQTIVDHREGVLRRLNAEDKAAVEQYCRNNGIDFEWKENGRRYRPGTEPR